VPVQGLATGATMAALFGSAVPVIPMYVVFAFVQVWMLSRPTWFAVCRDGLEFGVTSPRVLLREDVGTIVLDRRWVEIRDASGRWRVRLPRARYQRDHLDRLAAVLGVPLVEMEPAPAVAPS
jgi:hypothetical protein